MEGNKYGRVVLLSLLIIILSTSIVLSVSVTTRGDIVDFFRDTKVPSNTDVRGNVVTLFGNVDIEGNVTGDIVVIFGNVTVNGTVSGDVISVIGGITIGSSGQVNGSSIAVLGNGVNNHGFIRQQEISVLGFLPREMAPISTLLLIISIFTVVKQIMAFILSVIAVIIFNDRLDRMAAGFGHDAGKKFLIGLLVYFGGFVAIAVLVMTVIGVPLVVLLIPALFLIEFLGNTTAKIAIGKKIAQRSEKEWSNLMELLVGSFIFLALDIIIIGKLVTLILKYIGIGEIVESRLGEAKINGPKGI
ncbi:hypothetical protein [Alkaliphilus transvaalensis]|uniref:hypothetical protein n=1 Tax=Alkaliphilus transvaalensis TaxID=114628 RepID=UPI00047ACAED|nr:hypothetical protein [Alkaliphilus transvaalensis]